MDVDGVERQEIVMKREPQQKVVTDGIRQQTIVSRPSLSVSHVILFTPFVIFPSIPKSDASSQSNSALSPTGPILTIAFGNAVGAYDLYTVRTTI